MEEKVEFDFYFYALVTFAPNRRVRAANERGRSKRGFLGLT